MGIIKLVSFASYKVHLMIHLLYVAMCSSCDSFALLARPRGDIVQEKRGKDIHCPSLLDEVGQSEWTGLANSLETANAEKWHNLTSG